MPKVLQGLCQTSEWSPRGTRIAVKSGHGTLDVSRAGTNPWRLPRNEEMTVIDFKRAYAGLRPQKVISA
jgi:hypothetical protein